MTLIHYIRLAIRESRRSRGRIFLFMACIAVGVAAVVIVAGLSRSVEQGVRTEGRRLMAADLAVEGRRPLPTALNDLLAREPGGARVQRTDVREFASIVAGGGAGGEQSQLAELKVVDGSNSMKPYWNIKPMLLSVRTALMFCSTLNPLFRTSSPSSLPDSSPM